jgi:hypothetical protein
MALAAAAAAANKNFCVSPAWRLHLPSPAHEESCKHLLQTLNNTFYSMT